MTAHRIPKSWRSALALVAFVVSVSGLAAGAGAQTPTPGALSRVGSYRIRKFTSPQQIEALYSLNLFPDFSAALVELRSDDANVSEGLSRGVWTQKGNVVEAVFYDVHGAAVSPQPLMRLTFDGSFITDVVASNRPADETGLKFTLNAGDTHPAMRELNRRLARVAGLGYADPGPSGDIFTQATLEAVAKFQQSRGLLPTGYVDPTTWQALGDPAGTPATPAPQATREAPRPVPLATVAAPGLVPTRAPLAFEPAPTALLPTPTPPPPANATACAPTLTTHDVQNLRPYPTTAIAPIGTLPANTTLPITAKNADGTWWQVNFNGTQGWAFGELVTVACVANVPVNNAPIPAPTAAPTAPPPAAQPAAGSGDKVIYLTFDDGPSAAWSPQILDVLKKYGVKATFYWIGQQVGPNASIAKRVVADGHGAGNHSWEHASLAGVSQSQFDKTIGNTRHAIVEVGGHHSPSPNCLRPPYGATDANTRPWANQQGYNVHLWTIDTMDWSLPGTDQIIHTVMSQAKPGSVILQHDGGGNRAQTLAAVDTYIPLLQQQGYRFEVVPCL